MLLDVKERSRKVDATPTIQCGVNDPIFKKFNNRIVDEYEGIENINELESDQSKDRLKEIALFIACKKVAEQNYLSLDEQMNI